MDDPVVGSAIVLAVVAIALVVSYLTRRKTSYHPPIDVDGLGLPVGLVVFTSTACHRCKDTLAVARALDVPLREVTYELESELQDRAGVCGVPLTLVIDRSGKTVAQVAGRLRKRRLQRAVTRAGF